MRWIVGAVRVGLILVVGQAALADRIVDQTTGPFLGNIASQVFPNAPTLNIVAFDDFTIGTAYRISTFVALGNEQGDPGANVRVVAGIYAAPDFTTSPILGVEGSQVAEDLVFDFGGATLAAGTYWIAAHVVRSNNPGGQWFWRAREVVSGSEAYYHAPGGSPPFGPAPQPIRRLFNNRAGDLLYTLDGTVVPEPSGFVLLGIGAAIGSVAVLRRRRAAGRAA